MKLVNIEIERFRSVKKQTGSKSIEFQGLDCLVGENNAGKTNILSAVRFLLENETKQNDSELFWQKRDNKTVEVRGYFEITPDDLNRIDNSEKRNQIEDILLKEEDGYEAILGVCRNCDGGSDSSPSFKLLQELPAKEKLQKSTIESVRDELNKRSKNILLFRSEDND